MFDAEASDLVEVSVADLREQIERAYRKGLEAGASAPARRPVGDAVANVLKALAGASAPVQKAAAHAPKGGVSVQGTNYPGGQFIPAEVMERATDEEKAKVEGKDKDESEPGEGEEDRTPEAEFAESYFEEDDPTERANNFLKTYDEMDLDALPADTQDAIAEDLAHLPPADLAAELVSAASDGAACLPYLMRAAQQAGHNVTPEQIDAGADGWGTKYSVFVPNEANEDVIKAARLVAAHLLPAVGLKFVGADGPLVVRDGSPLEKLLSEHDDSGQWMVEDESLHALFGASTGANLLAQGDAPASARDYGGTSGSKGTGEFKPEEDWNPNAVDVYRRISDDLFVRRNSLGKGEEAYALVHKDEVPDLTRLPAPYWEGLEHDPDQVPEPDDELYEQQSKRDEKQSEEGASAKQRIREHRDAIRGHQATAREMRQQWHAALAGVPEADRPDEPDWDGPDSSALADKYESRADHADALDGLAGEWDAHTDALADEVQNAQDHAENHKTNTAASAQAKEEWDELAAELDEDDVPAEPEWEDDLGGDPEHHAKWLAEQLGGLRETVAKESKKHNAAHDKHRKTWDEHDAAVKKHLARAAELRAEHAEPDAALNDDVVNATAGWEGTPDSAEDAEADDYLGQLSDALQDVYDGPNPDHADEHDIDPDDYDGTDDLPAEDWDGTAAERAETAKEAAESHAERVKELGATLKEWETELPAKSKAWRDTMRADLSAVRDAARQALTVPEDRFGDDEGRGKVAALAEQLEAFLKRLKEPAPVRKAAAHAPKGGVTVQGTDYAGGQFIPHEVMERATDEERKAVLGGKPKGRQTDKSRARAAHAFALKTAIAKFHAAKKPTRAERAANRRGMKALGANKYRKNLTGNSTDRKKRRDALLAEFGDGTNCPCVYCGVKLGHGTLEQDKLYTTGEGGRYRPHNVVPACSGCNKHRSDKSFLDFASTIKAREGEGDSSPAPETEKAIPQELQDVAAKWVGAASGLSDEVKIRYTADTAKALAALPEKVLDGVRKVMELRKFVPTYHADNAALNKACSQITGKREKGVEGFVHTSGNSVFGVHLDGGSDTDSGAKYRAVGTYVHEFWHIADDGYHSSTDAWKKAWKKEIKGGSANNILSLYAMKNEEEGFAEFGRYIAEHGAETTKKRYPKCYAALEKQGLL